MVKTTNTGNEPDQNMIRLRRWYAFILCCPLQLGRVFLANYIFLLTVVFAIGDYQPLET